MQGDRDGAARPPRTPADLREGVRRAVSEALALEVDRTSARTAGLLAGAGALGLAGAVGAVVLFSGHSLENGHGWHLALCAAAWAGLLVECFAVVLLRLRAGRIPLAQACALALLGLGLAAVLGWVCPDPRYLGWWGSTRIGALAYALGGPATSALCLGLCSAALVGGGATLILALRGVTFRSALLPTLLLFLMLWPAVVLQSADAPARVFATWSAGLLAGSWAGVTLGLWPSRFIRRRLGAARPESREGG
jgi:hypothetical protein